MPQSQDVERGKMLGGEGELVSHFTGSSSQRKMMMYGTALVIGLIVIGGIGFWNNASPGRTHVYDEKPGTGERDPAFTGQLEEVDKEYRYGNMHYYKYGDPNAKTQVYVLHGGDPDQSGLHWEPNLSLLESLGTFHLLDLPGFGKSTIFDFAKDVPNYNGAMCLLDIMEEDGVVDDPDRELVFIAKSYGAEVLLQLFRHRPKLFDKDVKMILIAPSPTFSRVEPEQKAYLGEVPGLMIISEYDDRIPEGFFRLLLSTFKSLKLQILEGLSVHDPEKVMPQTFAKIVTDWWQNEAHASY